MNRSHSTDEYWSASVELESVTDAVDWCKAHASDGTYDFKWMIDYQPDGNIVGWFAFSNHDDMVLFSLHWC